MGFKTPFFADTPIKAQMTTTIILYLIKKKILKQKHEISSYPSINYKYKYLIGRIDNLANSRCLHVHIYKNFLLLMYIHLRNIYIHLRKIRNIKDLIQQHTYVPNTHFV